MKRCVFLVLMLGLSLPVWGGPAFVSRSMTCGFLNSRGEIIGVPGGVTIVGGLTPDGAYIDPRVVSYRCEGDQGFPAGRMIRFNYANTGQYCGFDYPCGVANLSTQWQEIITPSGHIQIDCVAVLKNTVQAPAVCP